MPVKTTPKRLGAAGFSLAAACFLAASGALAQQTVIIGGGPSPRPLSAIAAPSIVGGGAGGIIVNNSVLDSLGPGATGGLPLAAPQMPVYGADGANPGVSVAPNALGAYRAPGSGQLVVTRPSTLLYPPLQAPKSRLAVAPVRRVAVAPARRAAKATAAQPSTAASSGGKLISRLIAAPPKKRPAAVAAPKAPKAAPQVAVKTAKAPASKPAKTASAPAKPSIPAPPPASLIAKLQDDTADQMAIPKPPKTTAPKAATPKVAAPKAPSVPAPKAPSVPAPKVAAPAIPAAPSAPSVTPAETKVAALPPAKDQAAAPPGGDLRLTFTDGSAELSAAVKQQLDELAQSLEQQPAKRVQLLAFATDGGGGASKARRLSLSRALAVRAFLIDKGVRSTRMDVRALGSKAGDGPADRVDILTQ